MAKAIPGVDFIHASQANPSRRSNTTTCLKQSNFSRCPHVGDLAGAVESSYGASERVDFEFPENKINIDKFPKMFMDRTNGKYLLNIAICRDILK